MATDDLTVSGAEALERIADSAAAEALTLDQARVELARMALYRCIMHPERVSLTQIADVMRGLAESREDSDGQEQVLQSWWGDDEDEDVQGAEGEPGGLDG